MQRPGRPRKRRPSRPRASFRFTGLLVLGAVAASCERATNGGATSVSDSAGVEIVVLDSSAFEAAALHVVDRDPTLRLGEGQIPPWDEFYRIIDAEFVNDPWLWRYTVFDATGNHGEVFSPPLTADVLSVYGFLRAGRALVGSRRRSLAHDPNRTGFYWDSTAPHTPTRSTTRRIRRYTVPPDSTETWWVYDRTTHAVRGVTLPPGFRARAFRGSRVLGTETDTLDVEYVSLYDLPRG